MQTSSRNVVRASVLVIGLLFSGASLAMQKNGSSSDDDTANCLNQAAIQYSLDMAQCAPYPQYSGAYGACMSNAALAYSQAVISCNKSEAALSPLGGSGRPPLTVAPADDDGGAKPGKPARFAANAGKFKLFGN